MGRGISDTRCPDRVAPLQWRGRPGALVGKWALFHLFGHPPVTLSTPPTPSLASSCCVFSVFITSTHLCPQEGANRDQLPSKRPFSCAGDIRLLSYAVPSKRTRVPYDRSRLSKETPLLDSSLVHYVFDGQEGSCWWWGGMGVRFWCITQDSRHDQYSLPPEP